MSYNPVLDPKAFTAPFSELWWCHRSGDPAKPKIQPGSDVLPNSPKYLVNGAQTVVNAGLGGMGHTLTREINGTPAVNVNFNNSEECLLSTDHENISLPIIIELPAGVSGVGAYLTVGRKTALDIPNGSKVTATMMWDLNGHGVNEIHSSQGVVGDLGYNGVPPFVGIEVPSGSVVTKIWLNAALENNRRFDLIISRLYWWA